MGDLVDIPVNYSLVQHGHLIRKIGIVKWTIEIDRVLKTIYTKRSFLEQPKQSKNPID